MDLCFGAYGYDFSFWILEIFGSVFACVIFFRFNSDIILRKDSEFYLRFWLKPLMEEIFGNLDSVLSVLLILGSNTENKSVILRLLHRFNLLRFLSLFFSLSSS